MCVCANCGNAVSAVFLCAETLLNYMSNHCSRWIYLNIAVHTWKPRARSLSSHSSHVEMLDCPHAAGCLFIAKTHLLICNCMFDISGLRGVLAILTYSCFLQLLFQFIIPHLFAPSHMLSLQSVERNSKWYRCMYACCSLNATLSWMASVTHRCGSLEHNRV